MANGLRNTYYVWRPLMRTLKIAQVATSEISIRLLLVDQIKALEALGYDVIAVAGGGVWAASTVECQGIQFHSEPMAREIKPLQDLRSLFRLVAYFRREKFDVVHTHTPKAGLLAPLAARLAGVPTIVHTVHGLLFHDQMSVFRRIIFWWVEKFTATCAHYLLSQSQEDIAVAQRTRVCRKQKIQYVGNGIDISRFNGDRSHRLNKRQELGFSNDDFVVGFVGRLVYEKGFAELAAAARALSKRYTSIKFVIIGPEEPDQDDAVSSDVIRALRTEGVMSFLGWQSTEAMPALYAMMDVFALPSHREGIPRAAMEAAAMEVPVVASDIRGCREVVTNQKTGILVPVKNPAALIAAIERLYLDAELTRRLGVSGRERILERFTNAIVLKRLTKFYETLELRPRKNKA